MPVRFSHTAQSHSIYFITFTCHKWRNLFSITNSYDAVYKWFDFLYEKKNRVMGFVIMPNHMHLIWSQDGMNGKETPKGSLLKYTAHVFLDHLKATGKSELYKVKASNKKHEIWQRDSLGIEIYDKKIAQQKLNYIHFNPVSGKWRLSKNDLDYYYSSARFYETGIDEFGFLKNLFETF